MSRRTSRLKVHTAVEVCACYRCSDLTGHLINLKKNQSAHAFLDGLLDRGMWADAVDFLAHGLRLRDAVWWGCLGIRHVLGKKLGPKEAQALFRAGAWVVDATASTRETARRAAAEIHHTSSPACLVALAAAEGDAREAHAAGRIAAAIKTLADKGNTDHRTLRQLLVIGLAIADGHHSWDGNH